MKQLQIALKKITAVSALSSLMSIIIIQPSYGMNKDPMYISSVKFEQLEYRFIDDDSAIVWQGNAYYGTDEWKVRFQSEAEFAVDADEFEALENQLLYQFPVSTFFDAQFGLRYDSPTEQDNRLYGVAGIQGLAPQWFEIDINAFISEDGKISGRLDADYELLITNRLILTPTLEINIALSDDEAIGLGAGLQDIETGFRLSYDLIGRELVPYIVINYERQFGQTADLSQLRGKADEIFSTVIGVRLLF